MFNFFPIFSFFLDSIQITFHHFCTKHETSTQSCTRDIGKPGFRGVSLNNIRGVIKVKEEKLSGHQCRG